MGNPILPRMIHVQGGQTQEVVCHKTETTKTIYRNIQMIHLIYALEVFGKRE